MIRTDAVPVAFRTVRTSPTAAGNPPKPGPNAAPWIAVPSIIATPGSAPSAADGQGAYDGPVPAPRVARPRRREVRHAEGGGAEEVESRALADGRLLDRGLDHRLDPGHRRDREHPEGEAGG